MVVKLVAAEIRAIIYTMRLKYMPMIKVVIMGRLLNLFLDFELCFDVPLREAREPLAFIFHTVMTYNTHHFQRCIATLQLSIQMLKSSKSGSTQYEVYRNAVIKGFELVLEMTGSLLRKALKAYGGNPRSVDDLSFKDVLRHAGKHGLLDTDAIARWFNYRNNRNVVAHDYGEKFAEQTLVLLPGFIADASHLAVALQKAFAQEGNVGS